MTAATAHAGMTMEFDCKAQSTTPYSFTGRLRVDGPNARYDVIDGAHPLFNPKLTIISRDSGETLFIIDHKQRTYFIRKSKSMSGPLSTWKAPGIKGDSKVSLDVQRDDKAGTETIAGRTTKKYVAHAEYDLRLELEGEKLPAHVEGDATLWTIDAPNDALPYGLEFAFKSGFESLDKKIERRIPRCGIPLRQIVTVTRTIADGAPVTETFTVTATKVTDEKLDFSIFQPPMGYVFREPTFGFE